MKCLAVGVIITFIANGSGVWQVSKFAILIACDSEAPVRMIHIQPRRVIVRSRPIELAELSQ